MVHVTSEFKVRKVSSQEKRPGVAKGIQIPWLLEWEGIQLSFWFNQHRSTIIKSRFLLNLMHRDSIHITRQGPFPEKGHSTFTLTVGNWLPQRAKGNKRIEKSHSRSSSSCFDFRVATVRYDTDIEQSWVSLVVVRPPWAKRATVLSPEIMNLMSPSTWHLLLN